jgi:signal transduction histidine kinase
MNTAYLLYSNNELFVLMISFVMAFLFYLSGAILRLIGKESLFLVIHEILWGPGGLAYAVGLFSLLSNWNPIISESAFYLIFFSWATSLVLFFRTKKHRFWYLGDVFALFVLLPFMQVGLWWISFDFVALLYLFAHALFSFFYADDRMRHSFTAYAMKSALDGLNYGLAIASKDGKILYVNKAFNDLLSFFSIDPHEKETTILSSLRSKSLSLVDEQSSILLINGHYYLLRERCRDNRRNLTLSYVDAEVGLNEELKQANESLTKEKAALLKTLDDIKALAQYQERQRLRFLVHDSFAEEVSLIHQVLINDKVNDLRPLKKVIRDGLTSYKEKYGSLEELERFYGLLGIRFVHEGDFNRCPDKATAISLIREATDNAIRHGNANEMTLTSRCENGFYHLSIANNGLQPKTATPHNGLAYLMAIYKSKGGSLAISLMPRFVLIASLPLPKG